MCCDSITIRQQIYIANFQTMHRVGSSCVWNGTSPLPDISDIRSKASQKEHTFLTPPPGAFGFMSSSKEH